MPQTVCSTRRKRGVAGIKRKSSNTDNVVYWTCQDGTKIMNSDGKLDDKITNDVTNTTNDATTTNDASNASDSKASVDDNKTNSDVQTTNSTTPQSKERRQLYQVTPESTAASVQDTIDNSNDVVSLVGSKYSTTNQVEFLEEQLRERDATLTKLKEQIVNQQSAQNDKTETTKQQEQIKDLQDKLSVKSAELQAKQQECERLVREREQILSAAESRIECIEIPVCTPVREWTKKMQNLRQQLTTQHEKELNEQKQAHERDRRDLMHVAVGLRSELDAAKKAMTTMDDVTQLTEALDAAVKDLESSKAKLASIMNDHAESVKTYNSKIESFQKQCDAHQKEVQTLQKENEKLTKKYKRKKEELEQAKQKLNKTDSLDQATATSTSFLYGNNWHLKSRVSVGSTATTPEVRSVFGGKSPHSPKFYTPLVDKVFADNNDSEKGARRRIFGGSNAAVDEPENEEVVATDSPMAEDAHVEKPKRVKTPESEKVAATDSVMVDDAPVNRPIRTKTPESAKVVVVTSPMVDNTPVRRPRRIKTPESTKEAMTSKSRSPASKKSLIVVKLNKVQIDNEKRDDATVASQNSINSMKTNLDFVGSVRTASRRSNKHKLVVNKTKVIKVGRPKKQQQLVGSSSSPRHLLRSAVKNAADRGTRRRRRRLTVLESAMV